MEVGEKFSSWAQFSSALQHYCKEKKVSYRPGLNRTVESANRQECVHQKFFVKLKYCFVRMVCGHSWKSGLAAQGVEGKEETLCSCPSSILVVANRKRTALVIQEAQLVHDHMDVDISSVTGGQLSSADSRTAHVLLHIGTPLRLVQDFIDKCRGKNSVSEVPQEVRCDMNASAVGVEDVSFIETFLAENPACHIEMIDGQNSGSFYLQTFDMRENVTQFTDGLLQVISHKIPRSVFTFICIFGVDKDLGLQLMAIFISRNDSVDDVLIQHFLETFIKYHQDVSDSCKGIVVDLSANNVQFLQFVMPQAHVAWSQTCILQQFEVVAEKSSSHFEKPLSVLKEMMDSQSEGEYNRILKKFLALAEPAAATEFLEKWDCCKSWWAQFEVDSAPGLEHQRAAIEIEFMKRFSDNSPALNSLSDIVNHIIRCGSTGHEGRQRDSMADISLLHSDSAWVKSVCLPLAAEAILHQIAIADNSQYEINAQNDMTIVQRVDGEDEFILSVEGDKCTCPFHVDTELPCQHVFAWYKMIGKPYCNESLIPVKWKAFSPAVDTGTTHETISLSQEQIPSLSLEQMPSSSLKLVPSAAMHDQRLAVVHGVTSEILMTCAYHSFSKLGEDLILLKEALGTIKRTKAKHVESLDKSSSSSPLKNSQDESPQQTKRGRLKKKDKESLSPIKPSKAPQPAPIERRHNLRTNIKHKFVSRAHLLPSQEDQVKVTVDAGNSSNVLGEEKSTPAKAPNVSTATPQSKTSERQHEKKDDERKELSEKVECDQGRDQDQDLMSELKREEKRSEKMEKSVNIMPRRGVKRRLSSDNTHQIEQTQKSAEETQPDVEISTETEKEIGNEKEEEDSEDEKGMDESEDDSCDETQSADNEESTLERDAELSAFLRQLSVDNVQQVMQAVSALEVPVGKTTFDLDLGPSDPTDGPVACLISSLSQDEDAVETIVTALTKICFDFDKPSYKIAACIIFQAFQGKADVLSMLETVRDWPSHLPAIWPQQEAVAGLAADQTLTVCGHKLSADDLNTLTTGMELSPKVIHAYLEVLAQRHNGKLFVLPSQVVHHWRHGNFSHMIFKKVHFKTFDFLVLPIHCGSEFFHHDASESTESLKPYWMSLIADMRNKTVSVLNPRSEDKYAIAANGYMLQWRRYMQIRSVHTGEMLLTWSSKKIHCSKQMHQNMSGALLLMNVESVINDVPPAVMTEAHVEKYLRYVTLTLTDTDRETTVLCVGGPECQQMAAQDADWLQCDNCRAWWHRACAGHADHGNVFYCTSCQQRILSVNTSASLMGREEENEEDGEEEGEGEENEVEMIEEDGEEEEDEEEDNDKENDETVTDNAVDERNES